MRSLKHRIVFPNGFKALFYATIALILSPILAGSAYPQETGDGPFCEPIDFSQEQPEGFDAAGKRAFSLNTGEPRTVRVIHFVPSDRPFRGTVEDSIKRAVRRVQAFFKAQMQAHGYGHGALNIETSDGGDPLIHRIKGEHADDHYRRDAHSTVYREVREEFDTHKNVYLTFIDNSRGVTPRGGRRGKIGGEASVSADFGWQTVAHELGHGFGLHHDFRNDEYVMSYGDERDSLSLCAAQFLSVHPYFNPGITTEWIRSPAVELTSSPRFQPDAEDITVNFKLADTDGLHQLILFATTPLINWGGGFPEVKAWRGMANEGSAVVDLEYERDAVGMLQSPDLEKIHVNAVDTDGNVRQTSFNLVSVSPYAYATLKGHTHSVFSVLFSPDGKVLASGSNDNTIRLWDVAAGSNLRAFPHSSPIASVAFSPDGTTLASGLYDGNIQLWGVATGKHIITLKGHTDKVSSVAFSPDGSNLASGSSDGNIRLWEVGKGKTIATLLGPPVGAASVFFPHEVLLSPDGRILASRPGDNTVTLWDVATGTILATLSHSQPVSSVSFSPDGSTLASGSYDNIIRLWNVATGEHIETVEGHVKAISSVSFSPDGTILASGSLDRTVRLWRGDSGKSIAILRDCDSWIGRLLFSPDGTLLASTSGDNMVRIWDVGTGAILATLPHTHFASSMSFSPDGRFLASSDDKAVELWDMSAWTLPRAQTVTIISGDNQEGDPGVTLANPLVVELRDQYGDPVSGGQVTFTVIAGDGRFSSGFTMENATTGPDGRAQVLLTLGPNPGPNTIRASIAELAVETFNAVGLGSPVVTDDAFDYPTWHLPRGATLRLGKGDIGYSDRAVAFSPDGKLVGVASGIGVWLYTVEAPERVALLRSDLVNSLSFSPDGRTLASAGGLFQKGEINLWDLETGTSTLIAESFFAGDVTFSPDGRILAYRAKDAVNLELWYVASGTSATTEGDFDAGYYLTCLTFSPDGTIVVSGYEDGTIRLWDVATRTLASTFERHRREVHSLAFSPDGNILASASNDGTVRLWDLQSGTNSATLRDHGSSVKSVAFSSDGSIFATGAQNGDIKLWHTVTHRNYSTLDGHGDRVRAVSFSPDGNTFATASKDGTVKLWDLASGNATTISGHSAAIIGIDFTPDGTTLASYSSSLQGKVGIWDVATGRLVATLGEHRCSPVETLSISPDGTTLATGSQDRTVRLWDLDTRTNFATLEHDDKVWMVSFSPDGTTLASSEGNGQPVER